MIKLGTYDADWNRFSSTDTQPAYKDWMTLLAKIKPHYQTQAAGLLRKISAFGGRTDTRRLNDWSFDPQRIHLIGIRRHEAKAGQRENDDVFVLLVNRIVFKFYGTTNPGKSSNRSGAP